jgi:serine protease Do
VVSIVVSKDVPLLEVEYVNPFGDDPYFQDVGFRVPTYRQVGTESRQIGAGTGFIVRSDGYIVTNRHVIDERNADYTVLLASGEQLPARVIYRDANYDLAVLKISAENLPTLTLGDSSTLRLGQTVVAIGNALGAYNNSVSVGIISGLERTIDAQDANGRVETLSGVIQTDAAINSGNSGGPLLDLEGRVVGMNVAVDQYANAIAFSIPINDIKPIIERVLE